MYGDLVLLDQAGKIEKGRRTYVGEIKKLDEAWLRDTLFDHPDILPIKDIDATFGPLIPLCKELRTDAGLIDAVFINAQGRLTVLECKLWKNPQARREVIAQTLHYVSALTNWTYADFQRQVAAALQRTGNLPFQMVRERSAERPREQEFVDAVSRSLWEGRFLILLAGDGIREGLQSLTELVNRNASKAFSFGLVEVALYQFDKGRMAIQPRILAATEIVTRQMTIVKGDAPASIMLDDDVEPEATVQRNVSSRGKGHLRDWWRPVLSMSLDDPEQEPPFWVVTNNVILNTPYPGIQIKAFASVDNPRIGIFLSGTRRANLALIKKSLLRERQSLLRNLPAGTRIVDGDWPMMLDSDAFSTDAEKYEWIRKNLNAFANALRPRLRKWYAQTKA